MANNKEKKSSKATNEKEDLYHDIEQEKKEKDEQR